MEQENVKLPSSSYEQLKKIIIGYGNARGEQSNEELSNLINISKFIVSKNNPFLLFTNIVSGTNKKKATDLGIKLARALEHEQTDDIRKYLGEIISSNPFLSRLVTSIRLAKGIDRENLSKQILYKSNQKDTKDNHVGANCIIDLLLDSGLAINEDKVIKVSTQEINQNTENISNEETDQTYIENSSPSITNIKSNILPTVNINIQLQIPETSDPTVYENFFKALKENLIEPNAK